MMLITFFFFVNSVAGIWNNFFVDVSQLRCFTMCSHVLNVLEVSPTHLIRSFSVYCATCRLCMRENMWNSWLRGYDKCLDYTDIWWMMKWFKLALDHIFYIHLIITLLLNTPIPNRTIAIFDVAAYVHTSHVLISWKHWSCAFGALCAGSSFLP